MRTGDKTIDESRQGEALVVDGKGSGKKLFLESYGCAMNFSKQGKWIVYYKSCGL